MPAEPLSSSSSSALGRLRPWLPNKECSHKYVTMVSPTPVKGLGVLLALAAELPHVPFLAVQTAWTKPKDLLALWLNATKHRNITVTPAVPDMSSLLTQSRVLLVPSLWHEPFGLVALEAALRGIP